jgi:hypothetical protein
VTETKTLPRGKGKSQVFWETIRELLINKPNELILVSIYNHPTVAYRIRRDINSGLNKVFPERGEWNSTVIRDEGSMFYGPRSGKPTWKHQLWMVYTPKDNK